MKSQCLHIMTHKAIKKSEISFAVSSVIEVVKCLFFLLVCPSGYYGPKCTLTCRPPSYGIKCQLECECREQDCDHVLGCRQFSMYFIIFFTTF